MSVNGNSSFQRNTRTTASSFKNKRNTHHSKENLQQKYSLPMPTNRSFIVIQMNQVIKHKSFGTSTDPTHAHHDPVKIVQLTPLPDTTSVIRSSLRDVGLSHSDVISSQRDVSSRQDGVSSSQRDVSTSSLLPVHKRTSVQYSSLVGPSFLNTTHHSEVRALAGQTALLLCIIRNLHNNTVSAVRHIFTALLYMVHSPIIY